MALFSLGEMFLSTVTFHRSDTLIFPYVIVAICNKMASSVDSSKLVDNLKTKETSKKFKENSLSFDNADHLHQQKFLLQVTFKNSRKILKRT